MTPYALLAADAAAISILVFGLYVPRHRRRDLIVAYLGVNAGVVAIASVLTSVSATIGLGIGLFGVLSIIRLRSDELDQPEVAYYFASLALGILGGTQVTESLTSLAMMAAVLAAIWLGDHPRLLPRYRSQRLVLDRAFVDERKLVTHLAGLLEADIRRVTVRSVDLINDSTVVEVRFERRALAAPADERAARRVGAARGLS